jgi:phage terminase large subunit-like protein
MTSGGVMSETSELAQKLKSGGEKFVTIFGGLTDQQWMQQVYAEGAVWTVRNILVHLMMSEDSLVSLFERIRQGGEGVAKDFEIDRYNAHQQEKAKQWTPLELLEQYKRTRARTVEWVANISVSDLEKTGRHPFLGITTLREMIKMIHIHNQTHYRDLRRAVKD